MDAGDEENRLTVEHVEHVDSTNSELLRRDPLLPAGSGGTAILLVAARQTGGRGRRQRVWISTPSASLTASFAREVSRPAVLGALALVAGVAVAQALAAFGAQVRLKWPNDLHTAAGKAGGILCEASTRGDLTRLVIGIGLNLLAPREGDIERGIERGAIERGGRDQRPDAQPAAGLFDPGLLPDRHLLARAVGMSLLAATDRFLAEGFEPFRQEWTARDMLLSRPVTIHDGERTETAVAIGIDPDGALLVQPTAGGGAVRRLLAEEVSIRPREH